MKIRHDVLFVSSVLFTAALFSIVPSQVENVLPSYPSTLDAGWREVSRLGHELCLLNLATIAIAFIVIWTGYVKGHRSSWFIMLIVVWIWFFPQTGLWQLNYSNFSQALSEAFKQSGLARAVVEMIMTTALMTLALFLPIKSFFWKKRSL